MATIMNGEGRTQSDGRVRANDYGDGRGDDEARVAPLGSDSDDSFITASEGLEERDCSVLDCTVPSEGQAEHDWFGSGGMHVEADEEEVLSMDNNISGNMRPVVYTGPPKRPTQTPRHAGSANVLRFGRDHGGSGSWGIHVGVDEEDVFSVDKNFSGNMRPAVHRGPPRRPAQTAGHPRPVNVLRFGRDHEGSGH